MTGKTIVFMVLLLLMFSSYVIPINQGESGPDISPFNYFIPPVNSFGMSSYQYINWAYFNDKFIYETNAEELEIEWNKNDDQISKFKYKFKTEYYDLYYNNITLIDDNIIDIDFNENLKTFNITYLDGTIYFNFTDIMISTSFEYDYILNDNGFKLILYNYLDGGEWELDPTFGYLTGRAGYKNITAGTGDGVWYLRGSPATISEDGCVYNLTVNLSLNTNVDVQCGIYEYDGVGDAGDIIRWSETRSLTATDDNWQLFNITPVFLSSSTTVFLVVCARSNPDAFNNVRESTTSGIANIDKSSDGSTPYYNITDSPLTNENTEYDYSICMYATYVAGSCEEACTDNCTISNPKLNGVTFTNGSTTIEDCGYKNFSINITDCLGDIDYLNITLDDVYHNVSGGNGTYYVNHTTSLNCNQHYHIYINASCQNGAYIIEDYYHFTTEPCCTLSIEDVKYDGKPTNTTQNCKNYNLTDRYVNVSVYINSTCDSIIDDVWINSSIGNTSHFSDENEGLYWVNWTLTSNLICNTTYYIWITAKDSDIGCNPDYINNTFWFKTCSCYTPPSCDCPVDDVYPVNGTTGLNWSTNNYFNLTADINVTCGNFTGMYGNISVVGIGYHNVSLSANGTIYYNMSNNYTCGTNYTFWVNITGPQCNNTTWYWFRSEACNVSGVECCDCFNNSCFMYHLNQSIYNYLVEHKYITEDSSMEIEFGSTLVAFLLWFFLVLLTIRSKNVNIVGFSAAIQMLFALYLFNNTSLFAEADVLILFFAVFIMAFGAGRIIDFRGKKKKGVNSRRYR